jgi:hypothetical protein
MSPIVSANTALAIVQADASQIVEQINEFTARTFKTRGGRLGSGMGSLQASRFGLGDVVPVMQIAPARPARLDIQVPHFAGGDRPHRLGSCFRGLGRILLALELARVGPAIDQSQLLIGFIARRFNGP